MSIIWASPILVLALHTSTWQVQVLDLDQQSLQGKLEAWQAEALVLRIGGQTRRVPWKRVLELKPVPVPSASWSASGWMQLRDGSLLAVDQVLYDGSRLQAKLAQNPLQLEPKQVHWVRFGPVPRELEQQWAEILQLKISSDLVVLRRQKALDFVEAVVEQITQDAVALELEGESIQLPRKQVFAVLFYSAGEPKFPEPQAVFLAPQQTRLLAHQVSWDAQKGFRITTPSGLEVLLPEQYWLGADFSLGKVLFLDRATPTQQVVHPRPLTNFSSTREQLKLALEEDRLLRQVRRGRWGPAYPLKLDGKVYTSGLGVRAGTELVFDLEGKYSRLRGLAGVDDQVQRSQGPVELSIWGDGELLLKLSLSAADRPRTHPLDLNIQGVRRLKIMVNYPSGQFFGDDFVDLCQLRVIK